MHLSRPRPFPFRLDSEAQLKLAAEARTGRPDLKGKTMRISDFCFIVAALAALGGMTMGIVMGITQDFTLAPSHAHLNLLGWVTMAIYGLYHRGVGRTAGIAGWAQAGSGALGATFMAGGLGFYLWHGHDERFVPLVIAGSLLAALAMVLFLALVLYDMSGRRSAAFTMTAQSG
jgi:hypothetical protein